MKRDHAYEALAEHTQTDMNAGRGELNAALKTIRVLSPLQGELLAGEIEVRCRAYRRLMPTAMLTPTALAKHWIRCGAELPSTEQTNRSVWTQCSTCGGDRFVPYSMRKAETSQWMREHGLEASGFYDEVASCPDCGPDLGPRY